MCGENSVHYWETPYTQPFFDNTTKRDITATVGQPALLHCRVRNLGDRAVSLSVLFLRLHPPFVCSFFSLWIYSRKSDAKFIGFQQGGDIIEIHRKSLMFFFRPQETLHTHITLANEYKCSI